MSKQKSRIVRLGGPAQEASAPSAPPPEEHAAAPASEEPAAPPPALDSTLVAAEEPPGPAEETTVKGNWLVPPLNPERPGLENQPGFWFVLGALTVGVAVLLGLQLVIPRSTAATSPLARAAPTRTVAARAPTATAPRPNENATLTALVKAAEAVPRAPLDQARARLEAGAILMVDVRLKDSYTLGHIKGSVNIPEDDVPNRLAELPKDRDIILYCS